MAVLDKPLSAWLPCRWRKLSWGGQTKASRTRQTKRQSTHAGGAKGAPAAMPHEQRRGCFAQHPKASGRLSSVAGGLLGRHGERPAAHFAAGRPADGACMLTVLPVVIGDNLTCGKPLPSAPQDVDFHPGQSLLATGVIDGHLVLHGFSKADNEQRHKVKVRARVVGRRRRRRRQ